jgi:hypothetical protein
MELVFQNGLFRRSIMTLTSYFQGLPIYRHYQCNLETFLLHKQEWQKKVEQDGYHMCIKIEQIPFQYKGNLKVCLQMYEHSTSKC